MLPRIRRLICCGSSAGLDPLVNLYDIYRLAILACWCSWLGRIQKNKTKVLPGLEPGLLGSEPRVLTNYTIEPAYTWMTSLLPVVKSKKCLNRGSNTGPLDLQSNALPTELLRQFTIYLEPIEKWRTRVSIPVPHGCKPCALPFELEPLLMSLKQTRFRNYDTTAPER